MEKLSVWVLQPYLCAQMKTQTTSWDLIARSFPVTPVTSPSLISGTLKEVGRAESFILFKHVPYFGIQGSWRLQRVWLVAGALLYIVGGSPFSLLHPSSITEVISNYTIPYITLHFTTCQNHLALMKRHNCEALWYGNFGSALVYDSILRRGTPLNLGYPKCTPY